MHSSIKDASEIIKTTAHRWNSSAASLLLSSPKAKKAVEEICRKEGSEGTVHFNDNGFEVYSFCEEEAEQMLSSGADAVKEKTIKLNEETKIALKLPKWDVFRKSVEEESEGLLLFVQDESSLTMVGVGPTAHERFKAVEGFLEERVLLKQRIPLGMPFPDVLQSLLRKKYKNDRLCVDGFAVGEDARDIVVEGNKAGIEAVEELVKEVTSQLMLSKD